MRDDLFGMCQILGEALKVNFYGNLRRKIMNTLQPNKPSIRYFKEANNFFLSALYTATMKFGLL